jgi:hypothetical protein
MDALIRLIRDEPLYTWVEFDAPATLADFKPDVLLFHCPTCDIERTFQRYYAPSEPVRRIPFPGGGGQEILPPSHAVLNLHYECTKCKLALYCSIEINFTEKRIRKFGQLPPFDISVDKTLMRRLGDDVRLFKNARILISHSYGIGACIYLRRVVENKINALLQIHYETRKNAGADALELSAIERAMTTIVFEEKLKYIAPELPEALDTPGFNPVYFMYSKLSNGIHDLDDVECLEIAKTISSMLVDILVHLQEKLDANKRILEGMRNLNRKK